MKDSHNFADRVFEAIKVNNATHWGTVIKLGRTSKGMFYDPETVGPYAGKGNIPSGSGGKKVSNRKLNVNRKGVQSGEGEKFKI